MIPALDLAITQAAWTPLDLFIGGTDGCWFDPSDTGTLFQTSTGTTLVGAAADPVGYMIDKSGRGHDAVRVLTDASRPTFGRTTDGRTYLQGTAAAANGTGFSCATNNGLAISRNKNVMTAILGCRLDAVNDANGQNIFSLTTNGGGSARFGLAQMPSTALITFRCRRLDADSGVNLNGPKTLAGGDDVIIFGEANYGEQYGHNIQEYDSASAYGATGYPSTTTGATSDTDSGNSVLMCGDTAAAAGSMGGRLYGIIIVSRALSQGERQQAIRWMSSKVKGRFN